MFDLPIPLEEPVMMALFPVKSNISPPYLEKLVYIR